jgi:hypothetical protein
MISFTPKPRRLSASRPMAFIMDDKQLAGVAAAAAAHMINRAPRAE